PRNSASVVELSSVVTHSSSVGATGCYVPHPGRYSQRADPEPHGHRRWSTCVVCRRVPRVQENCSPRARLFRRFGLVRPSAGLLGASRIGTYFNRTLCPIARPSSLSRSGLSKGRYSMSDELATPSLGPLEQKVMHLLWDHGPLTIREVIDRLPQEPAYTTIATVLRHLARKDLVRVAKDGRTARHQAQLS